MGKLSEQLTNMPPQFKIAALAIFLLPISLNAVGDLLTTIGRLTGNNGGGAPTASAEVVMVDRGTLSKLSELMTAQTEVLQEIARNTKESKTLIMEGREEQVTRKRFTEFEDEMRKGHRK